jgi:hypothetical protein
VLDVDIVVNREQIVVWPIAGGAACRRVQAAIMRDQRAPGARALLEFLRELGLRHA